MLPNIFWINGVNCSSTEIKSVRAQSVDITEDTLSVELDDVRTISVPLGWFPRLLHGTLQERANWRLIAGGEGIHWDDLDEDTHVSALLELLRVSHEVRVFPLQDMQGNPSCHLEPVFNRLDSQARVEKVDVPFEFQRGATQMLRLTRLR